MSRLAACFVMLPSPIAPVPLAQKARTRYLSIPFQSLALTRPLHITFDAKLDKYAATPYN